MEKPAINSLGHGYQLVNGQSKEQRTYHIERELGRGGFGITYLATSDEYVGNILQTTKYTIKEFCMSDVCMRQPDGSITVAERDEEEFQSCMGDFLHEAERLHKMSHEGIVPVKEVFEANGTAYYVMQFLGDQSLVKYVKENGGKLDEEEACRIASMVAKALDYLHKQTVTHLDVKPENIMMYQRRTGKPIPILIDFGLACHYKKKGGSTSKHSATGTTDGYSPLEQYAGINRFTPEADIYALGCTLYFMLTGKAPLIANDMSAQYLFKTLPDGLSDDTVETLRKSMEKMAERRTKTIADFLRNLPKFDDEPIVGGKKTVKRRNSSGGRGRTGGGDNKMKYALIGMGAVILILVLLLMIPSGNEKVSTNQEDIEQVDADSTVTTNNSSENTATGGGNTQQQENNNSQNSNSQNSNTQNSNSQNSNGSSSQPEKQEVKPEPNYLNLGYAEWRGPVKNGKPNGDGIMRFKSSHRIDSRDPGENYAEAGDYIDGTYSNGHLVDGTWHKAAGGSEYLMIGQ